MFEIVHMDFGSHLYGTSGPDSDRDYKKVYVPSTRDLLLGRAQRSIREGTKQEREKQVAGTISRNLPDDVDTEVLSLQHYTNLLAEGHTMALDMLFAPDENLIRHTYAWGALIDSREKFITRDITAAVKYCNTQLKKYGTKGTRVREARELLVFFHGLLDRGNPRAKIGDYEWEVRSFVEERTFTDIKPIKQVDGSFVDHVDCCNKLLGFTTQLKQAVIPLQNLVDKFGQRALAAEKNKGIDWKAVSHAMRVSLEVEELLTTGEIIFPLKHANHLKEIKSGQLDFAKVSEFLEDRAVLIYELSAKSTLPDKVDQEWIDSFVYDVYSNQDLYRRQVAFSRGKKLPKGY